PTGLQDSKRPLLRVSSHCVKDNIKPSQRLFQSLLFIVHNSFRAQRSDVIQIGRSGSGDYMKASQFGQLYGVSANVARGPVDEYALPGGYVGVIEEHLPGRDGHA